MRRILIVEDSASLARTYAAYLKAPDHEVVTIETGKEAIKYIETTPVDVLVLDLQLPDMNGLELMQHLDQIGKPCETVVITANGSITVAVDAMRNGAFDFLVKPFNAERLRTTVKNAIERKRLHREIETLREEVEIADTGGLNCQSPKMQTVYRILKSTAGSNATVFITGESGTGKEVCARLLHDLSQRASKNFVALNCAAIPKDLLESEIFGHVKGAFTGATKDRDGAALIANGGTLFLDEICEIDINLQAKLLRFLQTKSVQRVGEDQLRSTDVRIVCATNRDPWEEVQQGRFREDLYYRLFVIPVEVAPLRERREDILPLAELFLARFAQEEAKGFKTFSPAVSEIFKRQSWPGNVRQLENVVRNIVVLHDGAIVDETMLPPQVYADLGVRNSASVGHGVQKVDTSGLHQIVKKSRQMDLAGETDVLPLDDVIRQTIEHAIEVAGGSIPRAAEMLKVSPSTLYRRLEAWNADQKQVS